MVRGGKKKVRKRICAKSEIISQNRGIIRCICVKSFANQSVISKHQYITLLILRNCLLSSFYQPSVVAMSPKIRRTLKLCQHQIVRSNLLGLYDLKSICLISKYSNVVLRRKYTPDAQIVVQSIERRFRNFTHYNGEAAALFETVTKMYVS